jgi:SAM-dependent methyltransferase
MKHIQACPVCKAMSFSQYLSCKDYTVSEGVFTIQACSNCEFKFTSPRPNDENLGNYYKSESYISHSNTDIGIISKVYKAIRNHTLKTKEKLLLKHVSRGTILDYGCGTGSFLALCKHLGWKTFGVEPDNGARQLAQKDKLTVSGNLQSLQNPIEKFDAITLWHVLEHVTDLETTLHYFKQNLSQNGVLIIAVPNHESFDAKHYKEFWAAYDVPRHLYHFTEGTVSALLAQYSFSLAEVLPMKFDSYYVSLLSEKYKNGKSNYLRAFFVGLKSNQLAKRDGNYSSKIYIFKHAD